MKKLKSIKSVVSRKELKDSIVHMLGLIDRAINGPSCRIHTLQQGFGFHSGQVAYHLIPQQRGDAARFLEENVVWACRDANYGERMNRSLYRQKHIDLFGKERIERIESLARSIKKYSTADLILLKHLTQERLEKVLSKKNGE